MSAAEPEPAFSPQDTAFIGHPKGLGYLALTEGCERFSYYSMQTLLVLYMVKYLLLPGHIEHVAGRVRVLFDLLSEIGARRAAAE